MEKLNYEVNGIKYLLIQDFVYDPKGWEKLKKRCSQFSVIIQATVPQRSFFLTKVVVVTLLVPEEKVFDFINK